MQSIFSRQGRALARARHLADAHRFDDALEALAGAEGPEIEVLRDQVQALAARHWLDKALAACEAGQGPKMRKVLARARRYHRAELEPLYRSTDRRIRSHQVRVTAPEHWVGLLDAADQQASQDRYALFASPRVLEGVAAAWGPPVEVDAARIEAADRAALRPLLPSLAGRYPDDLAQTLPRLGEELARAVLFVAVSRPDLAALPLLELPESDPLVCYERARVAYLLGREDLALTALQGFASLVGGHRTIRRLNTGIFLAQMAVALGDRRRALDVLDGLPVRFLGRRPVSLYARLLIDAGRLDEVVDLLDSHLDRHPDHREAQALVEEARALQKGVLPQPNPTLLGLERAPSVASDDYAVAPPRVAAPAPSPLAGRSSGDEV